MYHSFCDSSRAHHGAVPGTIFKEQLAYIKQHFTTWTLSSLIKHYVEYGTYPKNALAITVDDGFENFHTIALPLLKEYQIQATVFVVSKAADNNSWLWFSIIDYLHLFAAELGINFSSQDHAKAIAVCKHLSPLNRELMLNKLLQTHGIELPMTVPEQFRLMSWTMLREAVATGLIEIGSHTDTHTILSQLSLEECSTELTESKKNIELRINNTVDCFCYPNGQPDDYTPEQTQLAKTAGYVCCTASHHGLVRPNSNLHALPRLSFPSCDLLSFMVAVDGLDEYR
jgi:peptidoglycan/xylan/chitin deacetylase (PgdA/CDA1 family)